MMLDISELCVCQIVESLQLAPSTISKHLSILENAGLVQKRKNGRWVFYRLVDTALSLDAVNALIYIKSVALRIDKIRVDRNRIKTILNEDINTVCHRLYHKGKQRKSRETAKHVG